jgi:hypothetical protein
MPETVSEVYIRAYSENVLLTANQQVSKARAWCETKTQSGGPGAGFAVSFSGLGLISMQPKVGRGGVTPRMDPGHKSRWAFPAPYNAGVPIEDIDITQMILDPKSKYQTIMSQAIGIKYDEIIFAAAIGTAKTGVDGAGSETWPVTNRNSVSQYVAHGSVGLTLEKFLQGCRVLAECDVTSELVFFYSPQALEDALLVEKFTSSMYSTYKALYEGTINTYGGVTWVASTHLPKSSTTRSCILMQRGAVGFVGNLEKVRIGENPERSYENQVYGEIMAGAVRRDGERIYEIQITES